MARAIDNLPPAGGQLRPRSDFDTQFIIHVIPRLRAAITLGGHLVRHELETFTHADARVNAIAYQLGRYKLHEDTQTELADWIDCQMLQAVIGPPSPELITPERLAEITGEPRDVAEEAESDGEAAS